MNTRFGLLGAVTGFLFAGTAVWLEVPGWLSVLGWLSLVLAGFHMFESGEVDA